MISAYRPVPDGYGTVYRFAVFQRAPLYATRLAWVLLDLAYTHRSLDVLAGRRMLTDMTNIGDNRSFDQAREALVELHLLAGWETTGKGAGSRTIYALPTLAALVESYPQTVALQRPFQDAGTAAPERPLQGEEWPLERPLERPLEWPLERPLQSGHVSRSYSKSSSREEKSENNKSGYVPDISRYTGCRYTKGTHSSGVKYDPLGTAKPPADWPHPRPTRKEILAALAALEDQR